MRIIETWTSPFLWGGGWFCWRARSCSQVIFSMSSELVQFGIVMGVVMVGFAIAFFALVREIDDSTFHQSLLDVFVAMLGEVGLFDEFKETRYEAVGTVLLVTYLIIMSVMLLNLLVAVLSTSHAKLEGNVILRVSRARLFMTYRRAVGDDVLPAPFNLLQLAAFLPCAVFDLLARGKSHLTVRQGLGRLVFWLVMGPVAIVVGSLLWLVSLPKSLAVVWRAPVARSSCSIVSRVGRLVLCVVWSTVGVPVCLTVSWLAQAMSVVMGQKGILESSTPPCRVKVSIDKILKESTRGLGMAEVRTSLVDPVSSSPYFFNRDADGRPASVGDVRLLRKRLEKRIGEVKGTLEQTGAAAVEDKLCSRVHKLEEKLDLILKMLLAQRNAVLQEEISKR